ncbi:MAG: PQQ-dependent sugar dehydrogenase [Pseudomonadota bacterium]
MALRFALAASALALTACNGGATTPEATSSGVAVALTPVAEGLEFPWGMVFLPNGDMLVTEREGRLRILRDGALDPTPIAGTPEAYVARQGGYLGLALDPAFEENRLVYLAYSKGPADANGTAVVRGRLSEDAARLDDVEEIFLSSTRDTTLHYGGRLQFLSDGTLIVTLGDGFRYMQEAQNVENTHGKIVRINSDGSVPADNPNAAAGGLAATVYSHGHRNVQGIAYDAETGALYAHEHGPKGGDELNLIEPGVNYGWPSITYGVNYDGTIITNDTEREGMAQPMVQWVPSIAPSGMALYTGEAYPGWTGDLFIGAMNGPRGQKLVRIDLEDGAVAGQEDLLADAGIAYRDVVQGPDGLLYLATADLDGTIYRLDIAPGS